jgi:hygromycin-B 7''-O-kinase
MLSDAQTVVRRTDGQLSSVYEVHGHGQAVIVKVYSEDWRWKQAKEAHVYGLLARHGVGPVPAIFDVLPVVAGTVMAKLPGRPLAEVPEAQTYDVYRQLGAILARIHSITQTSYGYLTTRVLDPVPTNTEYMTRQFTKKLREFSWDLPLRDAVEAHVAAHAGLFANCAAPVLCHNDLHEGNVLVTDGVVTGFVDVENAIAADPLMDIAKIDYYSVKGSTTKMRGLLDGYGPMPPDWTERLAIYRLYHALELWLRFASIGNTAPLPSITADMRALLDR